MRTETVKILVGYFLVSLTFLLAFTYGPLDLIVPEKHKKYKDLIITALCVFWPSMIAVFINTIRIMMKGRGEK